jgi:DNA-binding LytR/AlgR family response regulator
LTNRHRRCKIGIVMLLSDLAGSPGAWNHQRPDLGERSRLLLRVDRRWIPIQTAAIDWIDAVGNCTRFNLGKVAYKVRVTLADVERMLPAERFLRIHRSTIVHLEKVAAFVAGPYGDLVAVLTSGQRLGVGRRYRRALAERMLVVRRPPGPSPRRQ